MAVTYRISPASQDDLLALAEIEAMAVHSSVFYCMYFRSWADTQIRISTFYAGLKEIAIQPKTYLLKATNSNTGRIEGYIAWTEEDYASNLREKHLLPVDCVQQYRATTISLSNQVPTAEQLRSPIRMEAVGAWRRESELIKAELLSGLGSRTCKRYQRACLPSYIREALTGR